MAKLVICISGVSGVGKTWERQHNQELSKLPYADISDEYEYTSDYNVAWSGLIARTKKLLKKHNVVVAEAVFTFHQRAKMLCTAKSEGWQVEFRDIEKPAKDVLIQRIHDDFEHSLKSNFDKERFEARTRIVESLC